MAKDTTRLLGLDGVEAVSVELDAERNPLIALVTAAGQGRSVTAGWALGAAG